MHQSYEFRIEVWPGEVRIHQCYETEGQQTIELNHSQVDSFCETLKKLAQEAKDLGAQFEEKEAEFRLKKALNKAFGDA